MNAELVDHAALRSAYVDPLELILGRDLALDKFSDLAVDLAQFLGNLAAEVLIDLEDLKLDFGDLAPNLRRGGDRLCEFTLETSSFALQQGEAVYLDEIFFPEAPHPGQLTLDQFNLFRLGPLQGRV